jgi:hypothetical protein
VNQQYPPGAMFLTRIPGRTGWWVGIAQAICGMPSRWTHAGIVLPDDRILQAQPGGAVIAPLDSLTSRPHIVSDAPIRIAHGGRSRAIRRRGVCCGTPSSARP